MTIPSKFIIDTCAIIAYFHEIFSDNKRLSAEIEEVVRLAIEHTSVWHRSPYQLIVPIISFIEIRDKWCISEERTREIYYEVFKPFYDSDNVSICPFELPILRRAIAIDKGECSFDNHDKFIIATALEYEVPLITSDTEIRKYQPANGNLRFKW